MNILLFVAGLAALIAGAWLLVRGASKLALTFGVPPLVVGLTIVALGTSSPEVAVSAGAVLDGQTDIAVGNVLGSNIFNVLFILGLSALIAPLVVHVQLVRQEVPIMIATALLLLGLGQDGTVSFLDAALLFGLLVAYTAFLIRQSRRQTKADIATMTQELPERGGWDGHWTVQCMLIVPGLGLLVLGSNWLVEAASAFASYLGVSDLVIGLTIVAAGTSMPEAATSLMAAIKGERDIAVGNIVGSNIFNILGCLGISGLVARDGLPLSPAVLTFDIWVMLAVTFACLPVFLTGREIARWEGGLFLGYYAAYIAYLVLASQQHALLPRFSRVMLAFVVPLTAVTLLVTLLRSRRGGRP